MVERTEHAVEQMVYEALLNMGYPKSSIIMEARIESKYYADFIVNDIESGLPVMMIEVKSCSSRTLISLKKLAFQNLKKYYNKYNSPIKTIAAIYDRDKNSIEFVDFTEAIKENDYSILVENYILPNYESLTSGAKQKSITKQKEQQSNRINVLKVLCWRILPLIAVTILLLDYLEIYTLSTLRLIVVGVGAGITLIPCFKEISIGEISLKNSIEKYNRENEDK